MKLVLQRDEIMRSWYIASTVKRYHAWPTIRIETIAEHSHGVAMIYLRLFDPVDSNQNDNVALRAVRWILENDLAELWSGDAPFPVKVRFPAMKEAHRQVEREANVALGVRQPSLPDFVVRRIKACDLLQMYLFGLHELRMGNNYARPIVRDAMTEAVLVVAGDAVATRRITQFAEENPSD
jgi:5'-deoxynucleotidase YfbR-like HD superfamily hydrolase